MNFLHSPSHRPHQGRGRRQPEVVGFTIRLTNGTRITRRYVDQALPDTAENRELHVFMNRVEASEFVRKRREQCQAEHRPSVFDCHRYVFEPVLGFPIAEDA